MVLPQSPNTFEQKIFGDMGKGIVKKASIWEKVADFLMDIAKYVLTAVIITSAFEELAENSAIMYIAGSSVSILLVIVSIIILIKYKSK